MQYGCCPKGNPLSYAQVELARTNDKEQFKKDYAAYIWLLRELAKEAGIPVVLDGTGNGIKSHRWITDNLKGTTHRDPFSYLQSMGISEEQFKLDIKNGIELKEQTTEAKVMLNDAKTIPAVIIEGRTHVQVRELAELLGLKLVYNNDSKITKLYEIK